MYSQMMKVNDVIYCLWSIVECQLWGVWLVYMERRTHAYSENLMSYKQYWLWLFGAYPFFDTL